MGKNLLERLVSILGKNLLGRLVSLIGINHLERLVSLSYGDSIGQQKLKTVRKISLRD